MQYLTGSISYAHAYTRALNNTSDLKKRKKGLCWRNHHRRILKTKNTSNQIPSFSLQTANKQDSTTVYRPYTPKQALNTKPSLTLDLPAIELSSQRLSNLLPQNQRSPLFFLQPVTKPHIQLDGWSVISQDCKLNSLLAKLTGNLCHLIQRIRRHPDSSVNWRDSDAAHKQSPPIINQSQNTDHLTFMKYEESPVSKKIHLRKQHIRNNKQNTKRTILHQETNTRPPKIRKIKKIKTKMLPQPHSPQLKTRTRNPQRDTS